MNDYEIRRRSILEEVAAGRIDPAEAAERLAAVDEQEISDAAPPGEEGSSATDGISRVRVATTGHPVRVLADAGIAGAAADGPHTVRREGDTLVIQAELHEAAGFFFASGPAWGRRERLWRWAPPLTVRMQPDLALQADITASSLLVRGVQGPISAAVSAGSVNITGFASPIDIEVSAGSVTASGRLDRGRSLVHCSAGSVRLHLERGSSVRVRGTASAGRLVLPHPAEPVGARTGGGRGFRGFWLDREQEAVIGGGAATLDVEVTTGSVVVAADS